MKRMPILLISSLFLFSCTALHKKQSLQQSAQNVEITTLESQDSHLSLEASQWLQSWIEQLHYSTTLIHSDSTITYQPNGSFQLSKGSIILSELKQQTSTNLETLSSKEQESNQSHQQQELSIQQEQGNKQYEKERTPFIPLKLLLLISLIALLSPLLLLYKHKRNKI